MIRFLLRILGWTLGGFIALIALFLILSLIGMWVPSKGSKPLAQGEITIWIYTNGFHTDIILPYDSTVHDWFAYIDSAKFEDFKSYPYIAFGWGNKEFYIESQYRVSPGMVFRAVFLPLPSAMHMAFRRRKPLEDKNCICLNINRKQFIRISKFIDNQFQKNTNHQYQFITQGYGNADFFFEARGKYHGFNTCNNWTNRAIKKMGIRTGVWTPFDWGVMYRLRNYP
jgi:uncharacterized protein (TIGR02117 family)